MVSIRNNLIHSLADRGMTPEQIESLDLKSSVSSPVVLFQDGNGQPASIVLHGEGRLCLNQWRIIRPRSTQNQMRF